MRKPYYKRSHRCWYYDDPETGKSIRLDPDEGEAFLLWSRILDSQTTLSSQSSFRKLSMDYLDDQYEDRPAFRQKAVRIVSFAKSVGSKPALKVTKRDMVSWLNENKPGPLCKDGSRSMRLWAPRTKSDAYRAILSVYNWAIKRGVLPSCPIQGLKIDPGTPRDTVITPEQNELILKSTSEEFGLYLQACACGARPQAVRTVTAADVLEDVTAWVIQDHKTRSKTGRPLVVYLPPTLQEITRKLMRAHPTGPLFRNEQGNPWKKDTVSQKFRRLRDRLGLPKEIVSYSYRHTFATEALLNDVPIHTVSELLGHTDTRMVSKVYGHLDKHRHYLIDAAAKAHPPNSSNSSRPRSE
jgi:integrase